MQMVRKSKDFLKWEWEERDGDEKKKWIEKKIVFFDFKKRRKKKLIFLLLLSYILSPSLFIS